MNTGNLLRIKEDINEIDYIINHSDIRIQTIEKAASVSVANPYHNFDHELRVSAQAIKLARAEERSRSEINLVGTVGLFHDAGFQITREPFPEVKSFELAKNVLDDSDTRFISKNWNFVMTVLKKYILATSFPTARNPEERKDPLKCIMQDADLGHLGQGPFYWVWASMGLLEEFNRTQEEHVSPENFIRIDQEKFVKYVRKLQEGKLFTSRGASKIYKDPMVSMEQVRRWPTEAINCAYAMRSVDIDIYQFESKISRFL